MKRKRQPTNDVIRSRPFQMRVELLNESLCLTLKYNTEFGYLNGVTSAIQTQIDAKASNGFAVAMAIAL